MWYSVRTLLLCNDKAANKKWSTVSYPCLLEPELDDKQEQSSVLFLQYINSDVPV
jgi:hypothetical protein